METVKSHCNQCQRETNQDVLHSETINWEERDDNDEEEEWPPIIEGHDVYQMLKCRGCDLISFRIVDWIKGRCDSRGIDYPEFTLYPPAKYRRAPKWLNEPYSFLDEEQTVIHDIMQEIYSCLHSDSRRLATMGIRALIEHVMVKKAGDQGSFRKNLDAFKALGLISVTQGEILTAVLEAGHATIHRSYSPTTEDLHTCMDIAESIIETIYIHPKKAGRLKEKIPNRLQ